MDDAILHKNVGIANEAERIRYLFGAVVLAALDDAIAESLKGRDGPADIARWARSADGQLVLSCAGIDHSKRVVQALQDFVSSGVKTTIALTRVAHTAPERITRVQYRKHP